MGSQRVGHDWATFTHTHNVYNLDNKWTLEIKYLRVFSPTLPCYFNVAPVGFQPVYFPYNIECYTEESFLVTLMDTKAIEIRKPVATANLSSISLSSYSLFFQGLLMLSHIARFPSFYAWIIFQLIYLYDTCITYALSIHHWWTHRLFTYLGYWK